MSPLSDTTNLAPAVAGTDVFTHIWHMIYTTGPSFIITIILYSLLGLKYADRTINTEQINLIVNTLEKTFFIHPVLLLAPVIIIILVVKKVPPLPALLIGSILGAVCAAVFQGNNLSDIIGTAHNGFVSSTKVGMVDDLLSRGGLNSMMETVALIICALSFGGIMESTGMLNAISRIMLKKVKTTGSLVLSTILSCIAMNILAAEQYMAIVIPGRMLKNTYKKHGLHPKNLSRCLEDAATLTSPLIPWNSCGAFMGATLGISPFLYLPYAFLNILNPIISIIYGYTGFSMEKLKSEEEKTTDDQISKKES
jgi:NhaC family Na+:H+ antiporter